MFAITKKPLTKKDFQRAVRASTGTEFDHELVDVIFDVFDEDNDNKLGYDEFIKVCN
jgi:Ca2+-binding EF-hand superfamily protein